MLGNLLENGPLRYEQGESLADIKLSIKFNKWAWTQYGDVVYIDQPLGTGFSAATSNGSTDTLSQATEDFYKFLEWLLEALTTERTRNLYITGESYGGTYIPYFAKKILSINNGKLKGYKVRRHPVSSYSIADDCFSLAEGRCDRQRLHRSSTYRKTDISLNLASDLPLLQAKSWVKMSNPSLFPNEFKNNPIVKSVQKNPFAISAVSSLPADWMAVKGQQPKNTTIPRQLLSTDIDQVLADLSTQAQNFYGNGSQLNVYNYRIPLPSNTSSYPEPATGMANFLSDSAVQACINVSPQINTFNESNYGVYAAMTANEDVPSVRVWLQPYSIFFTDKSHRA